MQSDKNIVVIAVKSLNNNKNISNESASDESYFAEESDNAEYEFISDSNSNSNSDSDSDSDLGSNSDSNSDSNSNSDSDSNSDSSSISNGQHESSDDSLVKSDSESNSDDDTINEKWNTPDSNSNTDEYSSDEDFIIESVPLETPTLVHLFNKEPYYHIPDYKSQVNILDTTESIVMDLHIYVLCNNTYRDPYMVIMLEYDEDGKFYKLPQINYHVYSDVDKDTHNKNIMDECYQYIYPLFNVEPDLIEGSSIIGQTHESFKGYLHTAGENTGGIGINAEPFLEYLNKTSNANTLSKYFNEKRVGDIPKNVWVGVYEILDTKFCYNIPIDPSTIEYFKSNNSVYNIVDKKNKSTTIPFVVFSEDSNIERSLNEDTYNSYLFSNELPKQMFSTPRYILFTDENHIHTQEGKTIYSTMSINDFKEL